MPLRQQLSQEKELKMNVENNAVGLFGLKVSENGGPEETITTTELFFIVTSKKLRVGGFQVGPNGLRGAQVDINGEIKTGTYPFTKDLSVTGFYNQSGLVSSWPAVTEGGEITILEVDVTKKFARGTFKFRAEERDNASNYANAIGSFSLTEKE
ncbi:hypothetical protein [Pseudomonas fluorescens]|uniref:Uncharacterized protein n=1 Tax=Pseudomonas fluorescens TaxID=294 RepID=A0AAE2DLN5_PSEFL|nr:hypothetical protein [Pseudomonas fluorescens]KIF63269.1 hypothetical protein QS95_05165 [Pseudomonas fluorescens]